MMNVQLLFFGRLSYLTLPISPQRSPDFYFSLKTLGLFCTSPFSAITLDGTWCLLQPGPNLPTDTALSIIPSPIIILIPAAPLHFPASVSLHSRYSHFLEYFFPLHYYLMKFYLFFKCFLIFLVRINLLLWQTMSCLLKNHCSLTFQ